MNSSSFNIRRRFGHTLMELMVALVASSFLLAGLGMVMMIGREVAYTPTAALQRTSAAEAVNQIAEELRYATVIIQQSAKMLEFVVADRNADGTSEKIRYEWSGVAGAPLYKTINSGTAVPILNSVNSFVVSLQQTAKTTAVTTTTESAEQLLLTTASVQTTNRRDIDTSDFMAQVITPSAFASIPANVVSWNLTKVEYYARQNSSVDSTLAVQVRATGDWNDSPTSNVLGQLLIPESSISGSDAWNTATFATPIRDLTFSRRYSLVFAQLTGAGQAARIPYADSTGTGVSDSTDTGASWQYLSTRQMYAKFYGTYVTPGTTYNVTRNYVSNVGIQLQAGSNSLSRIDTRIPLRNLPELLASHWRADFTTNPTTTNANGDAVTDWAYSGTGSFGASSLINGVWYASGALETRPLSDFTTTTIVECRCRNSTSGGNGAVVRINADRQSGQYAPLLVYVQRQSDGSQNLTLYGKISDSVNKLLCTRTKLSSGFVRFRLTILPASNVVNLAINDEDQGSFVYPTYAPSTSTDRYLTIFADTSQAEFDSIDVRAATN